MVPGDVHLWKLWMSESFDRDADQALLSSAEQAQSGAFANVTHRDRFIQCRAALRRLLAAHLGTSPSTLEIDYGKHGKPELRGGSAIQFNVSHSDKLAVLALSPGHRVGVDIERVRAIAEIDHIAGTRFSDEEIRDLASVAPEQRSRTFFRCWTRKEAFIKAIGEGLSSSVSGPANHAKGWTLLDWSPLEGFAGAVAVENETARLIIHGWLGEGPPNAG